MSLSPSDSILRAAATVSTRRDIGRLVRRLGLATRRRPPDTVLVDPSGVIGFPAGGSSAPVRFPSFEAWCVSNPGKRASLVVSAHLIHSLTLGPETSAHTVHDDAKRLFVRYHGKAATSWVVATAATSAVAFGCALQGFDLAAAAQDAGTHGITLCEALPLWARALPAAVARAPALEGAEAATLLVVEGSLATCLELVAGHLVAVQQRHMRSPTADGLADLLGRLENESALPARLTFVTGWGCASDGGLKAPAWHSIGDCRGDASGAAWLFDSEKAG